MRYGSMSIKKGLKNLVDKGVSEVIVLPLYPHYAMSSYETVVEKVKDEVKHCFPKLKQKVIPPFYDENQYIDVMCNNLSKNLKGIKYDHILFSYHGIPDSHIKISDVTKSHCLKTSNCCSVASEAHAKCYRHQVFKTTELIVKKLNIPRDKYSNAFQSRLPLQPWLKPYTDSELERLPQEGKKNLVVITPAFVTDCLETLEEIAMEGKEEFIESGGESFHYVPCLNDSDEWSNVISNWVKKRK